MPSMDSEAHMDPDIQWADHEVQQIGGTTLLADGDNLDVILQETPVDGRGGLDEDEVAYPAWYRRVFTLSGGNGEFGLGFNMAESDFVEQVAGNVSNPSSEDLLTYVNYSEQGQLDFAVLSGRAQSDTEPEISETAINFREQSGTGPYVDPTDDLNIHVEGVNETGSEQALNFAVQIGWVVTQAPQGIPQFASPVTGRDAR